MSSARFHLDHLLTGMNVLPSEERAHAARSRRLAEGDHVILTDARGHEAPGRIHRITRDELVVEAQSPAYRARRRPELTLACALPKGPRQDTLIEKCTELGVAALWPLATARSVVSSKEQKLDKWRRRAIEAAKQSGQCWIPDFTPMRDLADVLEASKEFAERWVASSSGDVWQADPMDVRALSDRWSIADRIIIFIGPEGGWAPEELDRCAQTGVQPLTLGPNTLRIETAAMAAAALVHAILM